MDRRGDGGTAEGFYAAGSDARDCGGGNRRHGGGAGAADDGGDSLAAEDGRRV